MAALGGYPARELAQRATIAWGAALLAFSGAVHWGLALGGRLPCRAASPAGALTPLPVAVQAVLAAGSATWRYWWSDSASCGCMSIRCSGRRCRPHISRCGAADFATCVLLALTMFVSDTAGLT